MISKSTINKIRIPFYITLFVVSSLKNLKKSSLSGNLITDYTPINSLNLNSSDAPSGKKN